MKCVPSSYDDRRFWGEFIKLYRNLPVLWTKIEDNEDKQNKHLRDRALNILLRKYRDSQPSATLSMVKRAIKSLQSAYRNELQTALQRERSTGSDSTVYESPWWCFGELDFLRSQEEAILRKELITDNEDTALEKNTDENNTDDYCKNLADELRKLSVEQLRYAKYHFGKVLYFASKGLLTSDWPQPGSNKSDDCPTTSRVERPAPAVHTVRGIVRFRKRSASRPSVKAQHSKKRLKRAIVDEMIDLPLEEAKECELLNIKCKEEPSITDIIETEEDMIIEDTEVVKLDNEPEDDDTSTTIHQQPEDIDANLHNLEITLIDLQEIPEDPSHAGYGLLPTTAVDTANEKNLISVRLPSGPTLRRQCTMHASYYVDNVVANYSDEEFLRQFRMGRDTVQMLSQHLETTYAYKKLKGHGGYEAIGAETHVLAFLWFLGHEKTSYRDVAERFELSVSCLHDVIWRVCDSILDMEADVIVRPDNGKKSASANHFGSLYSIPDVIGCVGGTQIKIDKPIENSDRYLLRKGYYSMQLQAITNEHLHFVDVFVEYPGEPELLAGVKNLCADQYRLLGGDEYPCLPQLLVPYRTDSRIPLTKAQTSFNEHLQKARSTCANVFPQLKQRFRQLYHLKGRQLSRVVKLIKVCCILHNLASESEMALIESEANDCRDEEPYSSVPVFTYSSENQSASEVALGQQHRDAICANF